MNTSGAIEPDAGQIQRELVRRVLALEGRDESLRIANTELETTIAALQEHTSVQPVHIEEIARDVARQASLSGESPTAAWPQATTRGHNLYCFLQCVFYRPGTLCFQQQQSVRAALTARSR